MANSEVSAPYNMTNGCIIVICTRLYRSNADSATFRGIHASYYGPRKISFVGGAVPAAHELNRVSYIKSVW